MEKFVQKAVYSLKLDLHSRVSLAFRYGIACEESHITGYFERYIDRRNRTKSNESVGKPAPDVKTVREHCYFKIDGQKVHTIMKGDILITVIPLSKIFDTSDAIRALQMFETSIQLSPDIFTMQEVVDWRENYLESNGAVNKDTLRREIKKRKPKQLTAIEMLGLSDSFFEEVKQLREYVSNQIVEEGTRSIDFSDTESIAEYHEKKQRLISLGKNKYTTLWKETPQYDDMKRKEWEDYHKSDEYHRDMQDSYESNQREILLDVLRDGEDYWQGVKVYKLREHYLNLTKYERNLKDIEIKQFTEDHHKFWLNRQDECGTREEKWIKLQISDEYRDSDQETKDNQKRQYEDLMYEYNPFWLNPVYKNDESKSSEVNRHKAKPDPVYGVPFGDSPADYFNGKPCFFHSDCIVMAVKISEWKNGFHELHYENDKKTFHNHYTTKMDH